MGFYVNGFLSMYKVWNPFIFVGYRSDRFFPIQILMFRMLRNSTDARRCSYFELGLPVVTRPYWCSKTMNRRPCLCPKPVLRELKSFLMQTLSFVPVNLHRCWPGESKRSIAPLYFLQMVLGASTCCTWGQHSLARFAREVPHGTRSPWRPWTCSD